MRSLGFRTVSIGVFCGFIFLTVPAVAQQTGLVTEGSPPSGLDPMYYYKPREGKYPNVFVEFQTRALGLGLKVRTGLGRKHYVQGFDWPFGEFLFYGHCLCPVRRPELP
jgi:hypothetical protein